MHINKWLLILLTFCATIAQGLWLDWLDDEGILAVDIPLFFLYVFGLTRKKIRQAPVNYLPIALSVVFMVWTFSGAFFATNQLLFRQEMVANIRALLIFFAIILFINNKEDLQYFFLGFAIGAIYEGAIAVHQWLRGPVGLGFLGEQHWGWQAMGTFVFASVCGYYLALVSILTFRMAVYLRPKFHKVYVAAFFLGVAGLYATFNRANWLGFAAAMAIVFGLDFIRGTVFTRRARGLLLVILLVGMAGFIRYGWTIFGRFEGSEESIVSERSSSRLNLARDALRVLNNHPVTGVGLNNYREYVNPETAGLKIVHNSFLLVAAETGYIGGLLFILINISFLYTGFKMRKSKDPFIHHVATAALTAIIAFIIAMMPSPDYRILYVKNHIWMVFALTLVAAKLEYNQKRILADPRMRELLRKRLSARLQGKQQSPAGSPAQQTRRKAAF